MHPSPPGPEVTTSVSYAADYITISLEWIEENGVSYSVSTKPLVAIAFDGSSTIQFIALYNTAYNVNITANSVVCNTTTTVGLNYSEGF